ncbi:ABC transporter substrate-binding protein [Marisediminicola sp. LYQ134]|uniref:ABC transporter substrate-binding protein n=1 Tax=unclassified Marisediminicola TaxID=2618316 RepID=UPI00398371E6
MKSTTRRRALTGVALAATAVITLAGCSSSSDSGPSPEEGGSLLIWAWEPTLEQVVADYEDENPNVDIELVNVGTGNDHYTALQNAIAAGSGVPDVTQLEYYAMPQFTLAESVVDLSEFGAGDLADSYSPGPWGSVQSGSDEGVYGLPMDSGPMAMYYNAEVFDRLGVDVPTTWDDYVQAARDIQEADPEVYLANDTGDAGTTTSMIWQAGGEPYTVDGTDVSIDFSDEGTTRYTDMYQQLLDEDLLAPITGWSDEWFQGLGNGSIATLTVGAWMPANLESSVEAGAGDWRVAPMPQWDEGEMATAENGGSALSIPELGENKELAYDFIEYANSGDGVQTRIDGGAFPATVADLESDEFLNVEFEYFDGQKANEIFAESAANVVEGWSYLPFQAYSNSIFNDTAGQAYVGGVTLQEGLEDWQDASLSYAGEQGFTVD